MKTETQVAGGKYSIIHDNGADLHVLRNGEPWMATHRDIPAPKLILCCAQEIDALRAAKTDRLVAQVKNIDWKLLKRQKRWLLYDHGEYALGLINLLDNLQDAVVADGLATEQQVFGELP